MAKRDAMLSGENIMWNIFSNHTTWYENSRQSLSLSAEFESSNDCLLDWMKNTTSQATEGTSTDNEPTNRCNQKKLLQLFNFSNWILLFCSHAMSWPHHHNTLPGVRVRHLLSQQKASQRVSQHLAFCMNYEIKRHWWRREQFSSSTLRSSSSSYTLDLLCAKILMGESSGIFTIWIETLPRERDWLNSLVTGEDRVSILWTRQQWRMECE